MMSKVLHGATRGGVAGAAAGPPSEQSALRSAAAQAASVAGAQASLRASRGRKDTASEAAAVAKAVVPAAAAAATRGAARTEQAAADVLSATAAVSAATGRLATDPGEGPSRVPPVYRLDVAARLEFSNTLADPILPWFTSDVDAGVAVSFADPAEQGLWRDITLARRLQARDHDDDLGIAGFDDAPTALLVVAIAPGQPDRIVRTNAALATLTGYPAAELLGRALPDLVVVAGSPDGPLTPLPAGTTAEPVTLSGRCRHADGQQVTIQLRLTTCGARDEPTHLVCHVEATPD